MKLTEFMATLMPSFTKDTLDDEFEDVRNQLLQINIPLLEASVKSIGRYSFKSKLAEDMEDSLFDSIKVKKQPNFIGGFLEVCKRMRDNLPVLERLIEEHFETDISAHALTLQRINILQYIPVMGFVLRYMRAFMNYTISLDINTESEGTAGPVYELIPADRDWISRNRQAFVDSVSVIWKRGENLEKVFESIPDINVDPSNAKVVEQTQGLKADPMGMGFIPLSINPIFHFRKMIVNYQVERYQLAVAERDMLRRKVHNLRLVDEGRNDARIQKEIKYTEEQRVRPLNQKIQKWEQDYVHNA